MSASPRRPARRRAGTGRTSGSAPASAARGSSPPRRPSRRLASAKARRARKAFIFVVLLTATVVTVAAITGDRGYLDVRRQRDRLDRLRDEVRAMRVENAALLAEVRALRKDPYVIEKIAREKLGYARPGEIIFQFPPERPPVEDVPPPQPAEP